MKSNRDIEKLDPLFKKKVQEFLTDVNHDKEIIFITEWWRSQERQDELYAQGRTTPWNIVTWVKVSDHQKWLCIDIAFHWGTLYPTDPKVWQKVANLAKKYHIDWGYDLWEVDKPHFQDNTLNPNYKSMTEISSNNAKAARDLWIWNGKNPTDPISREHCASMIINLAKRMFSGDINKNTLNNALAKYED